MWRRDIQRVSFDPGVSTSTSTAAPPAGGIAASTVPEVTNKQQHFCEAVDSFRRERMRTANDPNPVVRAQTKPPDPFDWENRIFALMGTSGRFDTWRGTVRFHVEGQWVILSFFPDCKGLAEAIEFSTCIPLSPRQRRPNAHSIELAAGPRIDQDKRKCVSDRVWAPVLCP